MAYKASRCREYINNFSINARGYTLKDFPNEPLRHSDESVRLRFNARCATPAGASQRWLEQIDEIREAVAHRVPRGAIR